MCVREHLYRCVQEEAPSRRSVAELAGKFKGPASPHNTAANQTDKPVRRRPPRTLQIPKTQTDEQETPGATSPSPAKAKRNSALIEKLQANLVLSPAALAPSPKSPGFRLFPPAFTPNSPSSAPVTSVTTQSASDTPTSPIAASPLTEEGPTSFEDPPTAAEGSILTSINKNRARHSIRRRPPSRRHRKSSSGEEAGETKEGTDTTHCSPSEPENEIRVEGGGEGGEGGGGEEGEGGRGGEGFKKEDDTEDMKDKGETESLTCPEKSDVEEQSTNNMQEKEEEKKNEGEEGDEASSSEKTDDKSQEEKDSGGKSEEDQIQASTEKEEKSEVSS
ncbi:duboraya isoform X1 [Sphaeramia orbicularis]|uniref:duboraya isoform X1 n=1 Tax=Sphaeramia orbicularis TaxID=375764 RepID=UPI00117EAE15|nr:capZ-interacting protein-like isoform X1 [Sphaeramia orbicularis]